MQHRDTYMEHSCHLSPGLGPDIVPPYPCSGGKAGRVSAESSMAAPPHPRPRPHPRNVWPNCVVMQLRAAHMDHSCHLSLSLDHDMTSFQPSEGWVPLG